VGTGGGTAATASGEGVAADGATATAAVEGLSTDATPAASSSSSTVAAVSGGAGGTTAATVWAASEAAGGGGGDAGPGVSILSSGASPSSSVRSISSSGHRLGATVVALPGMVHFSSGASASSSVRYVNTSGDRVGTTVVALPNTDPATIGEAGLPQARFMLTSPGNIEAGLRKTNCWRKPGLAKTALVGGVGGAEGSSGRQHLGDASGCVPRAVVVVGAPCGGNDGEGSGGAARVTWSCACKSVGSILRGVSVRCDGARDDSARGDCVREGAGSDTVFDPVTDCCKVRGVGGGLPGVQILASDVVDLPPGVLGMEPWGRSAAARHGRGRPEVPATLLSTNFGRCRVVSQSLRVSPHSSPTDRSRWGATLSIAEARKLERSRRRLSHLRLDSLSLQLPPPLASST